ncbi:hypothetical protein [Brevundimonas sp.]|uniref:hypothetical protein n=1 Tax=Brevundimonas sp. TaxID=1871086 RepID=UPI0028A622A5|nr:hypothetical protein [Brevundimonas sp.]
MHDSGEYWGAAAALAAWIIGLAGLCLNGAGIILLVRQLAANRQAIEAANASALAAAEAARIATLDTRPWVRGEAEKYVECRLNASDGRLALAFEQSFKIQNIGRTPATAVRVMSSVLTDPSQTQIDDTIAGLALVRLPGAVALFPEESNTVLLKSHAELEARHLHESLRVLMVIVVTYSDHLGGKRKVSPFVWSVSNADDSSPPMFRMLTPRPGITVIELVSYGGHSWGPT